MPTAPIAPASLEFTENAVVGETTGTFTAQQQIYDWNANYMEASVSLPSMTQTQANGTAGWVAFFKACKGTACVFTFPPALCVSFPEELTTDGTTARYWRLKGSSVKWSIKAGKIYGVTFECREAT
jgi:hypothetical protein